MSIDSFSGRWNATATSSTHAESTLISEDEVDPNGIVDWLNGFDATLVRAAKPVSGLVLTIETARGTFTEKVRGNPAIVWYDAQGVLMEKVWPFDGTIVCNTHGAYLRPHDEPWWAMPVDGRYGEAILRYDDLDTRIADHLRVVGGRLIRTVNIVTDDTYLDRVLIVYERDRARER